MDYFKFCSQVHWGSTAAMLLGGMNGFDELFDGCKTDTLNLWRTFAVGIGGSNWYKYVQSSPKLLVPTISKFVAHT